MPPSGLSDKEKRIVAETWEYLKDKAELGDHGMILFEKYALSHYIIMSWNNESPVGGQFLLVLLDVNLCKMANKKNY